MHEQELRVRVGYQEDFSPFAALGSGGPEGIAVDILSLTFGELALEVEWVPLSLEHQISALLQNDVDVLACLGVTDQRKSQVVFGEPIILTGGVLFRLLGAPVKNDRIVTPLRGPLVSSTKETFPKSSVVTVDGYPEALKSVFEGRADAAALNIHVGRQMAERELPGKFDSPGPVFKEISLAPAWPPKHDVEFREAVNRILVARRASELTTELGRRLGGDD